MKYGKFINLEKGLYFSPQYLFYTLTYVRTALLLSFWPSAID